MSDDEREYLTSSGQSTLPSSYITNQNKNIALTDEEKISVSDQLINLISTLAESGSKYNSYPYGNIALVTFECTDDIVLELNMINPRLVTYANTKNVEQFPLITIYAMTEEHNDTLGSEFELGTKLITFTVPNENYKGFMDKK